MHVGDALRPQLKNDAEGRRMMDVMKVTILPTIRYYRKGKMLWQQEGSVGMEQELTEGGTGAAGQLYGT